MGKLITNHATICMTIKFDPILQEFKFKSKTISPKKNLSPLA